MGSDYGFSCVVGWGLLGAVHFVDLGWFLLSVGYLDSCLC